MMSDKFDKINQEDLEKVTGGIGNTDLRMINDAESELASDMGNGNVKLMERPLQKSFAPRK